MYSLSSGCWFDVAVRLAASFAAPQSSPSKKVASAAAAAHVTVLPALFKALACDPSDLHRLLNSCRQAAVCEGCDGVFRGAAVLTLAQAWGLICGSKASESLYLGAQSPGAKNIGSSDPSSLPPSSKAQPGAVDAGTTAGAAAAAEAGSVASRPSEDVLRQDIDLVCRLSMPASGKGRHGMALRCGAAAALSNLLGAPSGSAPGLLKPGKHVSRGSMGPEGPLMHQSAYLPLAKQALKTLEWIALDEANGRVAELAAWGLAELCALARASGAGAGTGGGSAPSVADSTSAIAGAAANLRHVSAYREDGATRPLVEHVLQLSFLIERSAAATQAGPSTALPAGEGGTSSAHVFTLARTAAAVRCLSKCPRLPLMDWGAWHMQLLTSLSVLRTTAMQRGSGSTARSTATDAAAGPSTTADKDIGMVLEFIVDVYLAALDLLLAHAAVPAFGIGAALEQLTAPGRFGSLPLTVQVTGDC